MILESFAKEIVSLFTNMHAVVAVLLCLGIILCLIEAIVPGFGIFGILGVVAEVAGVIAHAIFSGSAIQVVFLLAIIMLALSLLLLLFLYSAKRGILAKSAIVENKTSIPQDYALKTEKQLQKLIGKEGLTVTSCRPVGKIRIQEQTYEATCKGSLIQKGEVIKVVAIEDARIVVDKITY